MIRNRFFAAPVLALALAACGQPAQPPASTAGDAATAAPTPVAPAAPLAAEPAPAPVTAPNGDGETVGGDATTLLSPLAAAVAQGTPAAAPAVPARWVAGRHYTVLSPAQPTTAAAGKVEVLEFFWYGCGHCAHLEPFLSSWKQKSKPDYVEFARVPVMWNDVHRGHARLYYTIEALGRIDQVHGAVFHAMHVGDSGRREPLAERDAAGTERVHREFLKRFGISDADFDRTYRSFAVETRLRRAEELSRRYRVQGVPLMVVGGRYSADMGTAGGGTELIALVNDLAAAERRR